MKDTNPFGHRNNTGADMTDLRASVAFPPLESHSTLLPRRAGEETFAHLVALAEEMKPLQDPVIKAGQTFTLPPLHELAEALEWAVEEINHLRGRITG